MALRTIRQTSSRALLVLVAIVSALALTAGVATATSELHQLIEINTANDDMGSTAVEWSGATYNGSRHVLLTVDDEHNAYEFALDLDGEIDATVVPRVIELALGTDDFEGVAWIEGETYAFLSEGSGEVVIATVPPASDGETVIGTGDIERRFPVISGSWGNLGPEGIATDGEAFYVTREMPATVTKFDFAGNYVASVSISTELADASGIAILGDGTYLVVSHESRKVAHYEIDWETETPTQLAVRDADLFSQLEGIAVVGSSDVHLFGEDNTRKGQHGQTYSHLHGELMPVSWDIADLDCSGSSSVSDAIRITQIAAGIVEAIPGCGSGDLNGDGRLSVADAVMLSQCAVGIPNAACAGI